jgi:tetratricopeptide (TPR) repeat protein
MYNIIPLILILVSLGIIIVIVVRKFSTLANLNIESIQAEREARFQEQIISNRIKRNYYKYYGKMLKILRPAYDGLGNFFKWSYVKLIEFKENYNREKKTVGPDKRQTINKLFSEAEDSEKSGDLEKSESKYIEIISLDSKNFKAFKELGKLYFDRKDFNEAKQTFEHALKLLEHENLQANTEISNGYLDKNGQEKNVNLNNEIASIYFELTLVVKAMQNNDGALVFINRALSLEPNNPKYLDTKLEISIIKKDKISALEAYEKLKEVNPDNKKLENFNEQIREL